MWKYVQSLVGKYLQLLKPLSAGSKSTGKQDQKQAEPAWCVAANVVHQDPLEKQHKGTKYFAPGAKIYCVSLHLNGDRTRVQVVGRHRKSKRHIEVWMKPSHLANWRVELVYSPAVVSRLNGWDGSTKSKKRAEEIVKGWLPRELGVGTQPFITRERNSESGESSG